MTTESEDGELRALSKLIVLFYATHGREDFERAALEYFGMHLDKFLSLPPEEIQRLCRTGGIDEAAFIGACQELMMLAPAERIRRLQH